MSNAEKLAMLEEIMDLDEGTLSLSDPLEKYEEWDSLAKLSLIVEAKKLFDKVMNVDEIREFKTVEDICKNLS